MAKHVLIVDDATRQTVARDVRATAVAELAARVRDSIAIAGRSVFDLILHDLHAAPTGGSAAVPARSQPKNP